MYCYAETGELTPALRSMLKHDTKSICQAAVQYLHASTSPSVSLVLDDSPADPKRKLKNWRSKRRGDTGYADGVWQIHTFNRHLYSHQTRMGVGIPLTTPFE